MCEDRKIMCACGKNKVSFNFKDDLLPPEAVNGLYCPACSAAVSFKAESMISDNGWIIDYNMEIAGFMARKTEQASITPEFLFDEGYCTWRGIYPNEHIDSAREREELLKLAKTDPKRYFREITAWGNRRMERLARDGWRKAIQMEPAAAREGL